MSCAVLLLSAASASAQISPLGSTNAGTASGSLTAVAYDDKHDVYLQVWVDNSSLSGRFIAFDGTPAGDVFPIAAPLFAQITGPNVTYTRGAPDDVFAVVYQDVMTSVEQANTYLQLVQYTGSGATGGTLMGSAQNVSPAAHDGQDGVDVVFNPINRRLVVAWGEGHDTGVVAYRDVYVRQFDAAGTAVSDAVKVTSQAQGLITGLERLALDWQHSRLIVLYIHNLGVSGSAQSSNVMRGRLLDATTSAPLGSAISYGSWTFGGPFGVDVAYLPERGGFLPIWDEGSMGSRLDGRFTPSDPAIAPDPPQVLLQGSMPVPIIRAGGLAYDAQSRRVLVTAGRCDLSFPQACEQTGLLLDGNGQNPSDVTPLAAAEWKGTRVLATRDGQFAAAHITTNTAYLERYGVPEAATPGPRFSNPVAHLDGPANGSSPGAAFLAGGWALDFGANASDGTGIDTVHVWAFPAGGGAAIFLGADSTFHARMDVAAVYGSHFGGAGFDVDASGLPAGTYTVIAYAHSTISGTFTPGDAVTITVASQPSMWLDAPADGATVTAPFAVGGWAIDVGTGVEGTGIDAVHVWAYPTNGGAAVFVGAPEYGRPRPDIAAAFGPQFTDSGFRMTADLAPGSYLLVAYAHSTVTGTFVISQGATITVLAQVSNPQMALDTPANEATVTKPFVGTGWAVDLGAPSGTGVDGLHVWAFPIVNGTVNTAEPIFVSQVGTGQPRPDVGEAFGSQFTNSGYVFLISSLPAGRYVLGVYAHSTVSGTFNNVTFVTINVQ